MNHEYRESMYLMPITFSNRNICKYMYSITVCITILLITDGQIVINLLPQPLLSLPAKYLRCESTDIISLRMQP